MLGFPGRQLNVSEFLWLIKNNDFMGPEPLPRLWNDGMIEDWNVGCLELIVKGSSKCQKV